MPKVINYVSTLVKRALYDEKFNQIGRLPKFFSNEGRVRIPKETIEAWTGYEFQVKCLNDGIFLRIDTCSKFVNQ